MSTATTSAAPPALAFLQLLRLASPSLPVGGFSYSEGLEAAVDQGLVRDEADALAWLVDQLHLSLGLSDLPVVAHAVAAWRTDDLATISSLNGWVAATRETAELRRQSEQTGRSLAVWLRLGHAGDARLAHLESLPPAATWPVAFALAGALTGAATHDILLAFAAAWAENQVQAAMRAMPLGQSAGQRLIAGLQPEIAVVVEAATARPIDDLQAFTPMLAIVSSQHETQYSRLFRS